MADFLAINQQDTQEFRSFSELPAAGKRIINMDKTQIPAIRLRTKQIRYQDNPATDIHTNRGGEQ